MIQELEPNLPGAATKDMQGSPTVRVHKGARVALVSAAGLLSLSFALLASAPRTPRGQDPSGHGEVARHHPCSRGQLSYAQRAAIQKERQPAEIAAINPVEYLLTQAEAQYVRGDFRQALSMAQMATGSSDHARRAYQLLGAAACRLRDVAQAGEAYRHGDDTDRALLGKICAQSGLRHLSGRFVHVRKH